MKGFYVGAYQASLSLRYSAAYGYRGEKLYHLDQAYLALPLAHCYQLENGSQWRIADRMALFASCALWCEHELSGPPPHSMKPVRNKPSCKSLGN